MASGFNNTPPASEFHRHSSWGRTRRPKNVNGASSTAHALDTTAYFTENQRFLHVVCGTAATVSKIEVYYHGAGIWSELVESVDPDGNGQHLDTTIAVAAGKTRIFEVAGADKVRITRAGDNSDDTKKVWLLLSTF